MESTGSPRGKAARPLRNPVVRRTVASIVRSVFNPLILALAGSRYFPLFAVIHHRGRRSGRDYATPVAARPTADGFVISLTFGEQADWFRNLQAMGSGVVRWKGENYPVIDPEILDWSTAQSAFTARERSLLSRIGIEYFARLRLASFGTDESPRNGKDGQP